MNSETIFAKVLDVYQICEVTKLPIDCFGILRRYGYRIKKYSDLTPKKKAACQELSRDACLIGKTVYYDEKNIWERTRFSVMHELGHYLLETDSEDDADYFASYILAPRILIHKFRCCTAEQIHDRFGISYAASNRALLDYKAWFLRIAYSKPRKPTPAELQLEEMFFNPSPISMENL